RPSTIASAPLFVIGWCMMLYGVVECINAMKIYRARKTFIRLSEQAQAEEKLGAEHNGAA
ncbi:MAG: hypothetical protein PUD61_05165, partial [Prevotella sp.]|nr:hypothetical protein [Prevotella sp.]